MVKTLLPQVGQAASATSSMRLLLVLCLLGSASAYCSQGSEWIEYQGNCYHWTRSAANWFNAELTCIRFGGHLASIDTPEENSFVLRLTQCSNSYWIGMVNTVHSLKGQLRGYEWWDGSRHNFTALSPRTNDYYDCVYLDAAGRWLPINCQIGLGHVCKAPVTAVAQQQQQQQSLGAAAQAALGTTSMPSTFFKQWTNTETDDPTHTTRLWPTSSPPTSSPIECPTGWQLMDSSCYFFSNNRTNYFNAQMSCQAMGATVSSILTPREHTLLTVALGCNSPTWIGLEKARPCYRQPGKDHCWVWMDRSPTVYMDWAPNQNLDRRDAECTVLDGQWKVLNCYAEYRYICKRRVYER